MTTYRITCKLDQEIIADNEEEALQQFWQDTYQALGEEELAEAKEVEE